jgi:putative phosphoribosyl transferase
MAINIFSSMPPRKYPGLYEEIKPYFKDRGDAGRKLAKKLVRYKKEKPVVLGIPQGGIPVAFEVAKALSAPLDIIVPMRFPLPKTPEASFGAITPEEEKLLDRGILQEVGLTPEEIKLVNHKVLEEMRARLASYRKFTKEIPLEGKTVIIVDDGLASGFTMMAAIRSVKKKRPQKIIVAAPVGPSYTIKKIKAQTDGLIVLKIVDIIPFAIDLFYEYFPNITNKAVMAYLKRYKK